MPVNLSIKNVPDALAERLRDRVARNRRSLQAELMALLEWASQVAPPQSVGSDPVLSRLPPARGRDVIGMRLMVAAPPVAYSLRPTLVIDASVLASTVFPETWTQEAVAWIRGRRLCAPFLLSFE